VCVATNFAVAKILTVNSFSHSYRFSWFVVPTRDPTFLPCRVLRKALEATYGEITWMSRDHSRDRLKATDE
jgi:hypothetical protein